MNTNVECLSPNAMISVSRIHLLIGILFTVCCFIFSSTPIQADWLVLRDGSRIETKGVWRIEGKLVIFELAQGGLSSIRLSEIDLDASRSASNPPNRDAKEGRRTESQSSLTQPTREESVLRVTNESLGEKASTAGMNAFELQMEGFPPDPRLHIDSFTQSMIIYLSDRYEVALSTPNGSRIGRHNAERTPGVKYLPMSGNPWHGFSVENPTPGDWSVLADGTPVLPGSAEFADLTIQKTTTLDLGLLPTVRYTKKSGAVLVMMAMLKRPLELRISEPTLIGRWLAGSKSGPIAFNDNGTGYDAVAGDSIFTSAGWKPPAPTELNVVASIVVEINGEKIHRVAKFQDTTLQLDHDELEVGSWYQFVHPAGQLKTGPFEVVEIDKRGFLRTRPAGKSETADIPLEFLIFGPIATIKKVAPPIE